MDPLTQGLVGAAAAQAVFGRKLGRPAAAIGLLGGMLADADVFLGSGDASGMHIVIHRHFTHSLAFIPIGALLAALPFLMVKRYRDQWKDLIGATLVAYATHGLLDACTAYGTLLLWPFGDRRIAFDVISIIDPIFTGVLVIGVIWATVRASPIPARIAAALALTYIGLGFVQHHRAMSAQTALADARADVVLRSRVMPTLGNIVVWRSVYETNGRLHADAVRAGIFSGTTVREGGSVKLFRRHYHPTGRTAAGDVALFEWFADGYTAFVPGHDNVVGDMRYSLDTAGFAPMWGIAIDPTQLDRPPTWVSVTGDDRTHFLKRLWREVIGADTDGWTETSATRDAASEPADPRPQLVGASGSIGTDVMRRKPSMKYRKLSQDTSAVQ